MEEGKPRRRALAFNGGGLDTVMQLGVAHALLVSRSAPPDYVVGISVGAINAAAIAEVLQAGPEQLSSAQQAALSPAERLPFQVDQLRHFLQTYLELPRTLVNTVMPDSLEVQARDPLKPLELPIHFDRERQAREAANEAKSGLVNLINDLFGIPLTVATGTRIVRRILGMAESNDEPNRFRRFRARVFNEALLLLLLWTRFRQTAALAGTFLWAWIIGPNRSVLRGTQGAATADRLMRQRATGGETFRALRIAVQWFSMAHLFLLASAAWTAIMPLRTLLLMPWWLMTVVAALLIRWQLQLSWWWFNGLVLAIVVIRVFRSRSKQPVRWLETLKRKAGTAMKWCAKAVPPPVTRVLQYYGLADGLANTDIVKQLLVRCFDPHYYGRSDLSTFLNRSLDRRNRPEAATDSYRKRLSDYSNREPAVFVAPIVANVETGVMKVVDPSVPVVDALLAATAVVPFLPAVRIDTRHEGQRSEAAYAFRERLRRHREKTDREWEERRRAVDQARREGSELPVFPPPDDPPVPDEAVASEGGAWFIDGANISNEAIAPLLEVLRHKLPETKDQSAAVDIYPVSNLPISGGKLQARDGERFDGVLDVVPRALQLKRFRDASVEQRLTELYTKSLPPGDSYVTIQTPAGDRTFVRANVYPLELEKSVGMNYRLIMGEKLEYAEAIYQTVADGCRATLEAALPSTIAGTGAAGTVPCAVVIAARAGREPLPGSKPEAGPGLSEICSRCALHRGPTPEEWRDPAMLRVLPDRKTWPEWPQRRDEPQPGVRETGGDAGDEGHDGPRRNGDPRRTDIQTLGDWPRARNGVPGDQRALVSLLFGGGVFRGVFHMGVTNALSEMGLHPDVVAGSSVGSIIAAMIAQVFSNPSARGRDIAHLAATFVSIDRLVLTDRFADFVRRFTLRAADTPIGLLDVDYLFRRYDHGGAGEFNTRMRAVAAGIERLSYVSPFELFDLTRDVRLEQFSHFVSEIRADVQDFLDRGGVGQEILGSEPLVNLIEQHVLSGRRSTSRHEDDLFESFRDSGIYFLATATNIDSGELEILGGDVLAASHEASLRYGLLASSAFPAVFRPRKSWEIFRRSNVSHQYIDGGVIDNLPLDAVAQFLHRASRAKHGAIVRRPKYGQKAVPHLIFTASLEINPATTCAAESGIGDCLEVSRRARTFKYNRKIDAFASTQADLRLIHAAHPEPNLLDLHVVAVKPKWLCSTFGFHPMLGFRRRKQKQSIAHGCASTFATVFEMQQKMKESEDWLSAWGANPDLHLDAQCFPFFDHGGKRVDTPHRGGTYRLQPAPKRPKGQCWFRSGVDCPFSRRKLEEAGVLPQKVEELEEIYWLCGDPATHRPQ